MHTHTHTPCVSFHVMNPRLFHQITHWIIIKPSWNHSQIVKQILGRSISAKCSPLNPLWKIGERIPGQVLGSVLGTQVLLRHPRLLPLGRHRPGRSRGAAGQRHCHCGGGAAAGGRCSWVELGEVIFGIQRWFHGISRCFNTLNGLVVQQWLEWKDWKKMLEVCNSGANDSETPSMIWFKGTIRTGSPLVSTTKWFYFVSQPYSLQPTNSGHNPSTPLGWNVFHLCRTSQQVWS